MVGHVPMPPPIATPLFTTFYSPTSSFPLSIRVVFFNNIIPQSYFFHVPLFVSSISVSCHLLHSYPAIGTNCIKQNLPCNTIEIISLPEGKLSRQIKFLHQTRIEKSLMDSRLTAVRQPIVDCPSCAYSRFYVDI